MSKPLPAELIDLIFGFVPISEIGDSTCPSKTLLACTTVSRSFCVASRHRLFSTLVIAPTTPVTKTQAKLKGLLKLFEARPEVLLFTHAVVIYLTFGRAQKWAFSNDVVLSRILTMIKTRPRKLGELEMHCSNVPAFEKAFGRRTQQAILDLIPDVHSLTLSEMVVPATFMEKVPPLKYLHFRDIRLASQTSVSNVPGPKFPDTSEVAIDLNTLKEIQQFFQRSQQPLPAYVNVSFDAGSLYGPDVRVSDWLIGSSLSLKTLTFVQPAADHHTFDFSRFQKLTTVQFKCTVVVSAWTWGFLDAVQSHFAFAARILGSTSPSSNLIKAEINIRCHGTPDDSDRIITSAKPVSGLDPNSLHLRHPALKSVAIKLDLSKFKGLKEEEQEAEDNAAAALESLVGRCITRLLPSSLHVPNQGSDELIVYSIPLDQM